MFSVPSAVPFGQIVLSSVTDQGLTGDTEGRIIRVTGNILYEERSIALVTIRVEVSLDNINWFELGADTNIAVAQLQAGWDMDTYYPPGATLYFRGRVTPQNFPAIQTILQGSGTQVWPEDPTPPPPPDPQVFISSATWDGTDNYEALITAYGNIAYAPISPAPLTTLRLETSPDLTTWTLQAAAVGKTLAELVAGVQFRTYIPSGPTLYYRVVPVADNYVPDFEVPFTSTGTETWPLMQVVANNYVVDTTITDTTRVGFNYTVSSAMTNVPFSATIETFNSTSSTWELQIVLNELLSFLDSTLRINNEHIPAPSGEPASQSTRMTITTIDGDSGLVTTLGLSSPALTANILQTRGSWALI